MKNLLLDSQYLWDTQHIIFNIASVIFVVAAVWLLKNNDKKSMWLKIFAWLPLVLHLSSFYVNYFSAPGANPGAGEFLPFWWCNVLMVLAPIAYVRQKQNNLFAQFVTYAIIFGGVITLAYPTFAGPNILEWGVFKSFASHTAMILVGVYAIASGLVTLNVKKFWTFIVGTIAVGGFGWFINWLYLVTREQQTNYSYMDHSPIPELPFLTGPVIGLLLVLVAFIWVNIHEAVVLPKEERWLNKTVNKYIIKESEDKKE